MMTGDRILLDTVYIQALLNHRDHYHPVARLLYPRVQSARELVVTEAVLAEVGNALSTLNRTGASAFIRSCYSTPNIAVIPVEDSLFQRGLERYSLRADKEWGLTDCISFVVMEERSLRLAATMDQHFTQAGFEALMRLPLGTGQM
jgi:uncharacterized protein